MSKAIQRQPVNWSALKDRSVIITGGASGLGEATVKRFASEGAYVTIAHVDEEGGRSLAPALTSEGKHVQFATCDTTDWNSSSAAFKQAVNFGPSKTLDVAILSAGLSGVCRSFVDQVLDTEDPTLDNEPTMTGWPPAIEVNLKGVWLSAWLATHYFRLSSADGSEKKKKSLIFISSLAGYFDQPYVPAYSASKHGVRGLFRAIRSEMHKVNARVTNIAPSFILTPLTMRNHGITSPEQKRKVLGAVVPWAPVEHFVEAAGRCAVDDLVDGRTLGIFPDGFVDIEEDADAENVDKVTCLVQTELLGRIVTMKDA